MAVGAGGRSEVPEMVSMPFKPRVVGLLEASCAKSGRSSSKPAAGSAAAVVAERRRPSVDSSDERRRPSVEKFPVSARAHRSPNPQPGRGPPVARPRAASLRSTPEHTAPQCPPRPPSPSKRQAAQVVAGAPRQPVPPPRSSSRASSPRVRPLSARREANVQQCKTEAATAPDVDTKRMDVAEARAQHLQEHLVTKSPVVLLRNDRPVATPCSPSKASARSPVGDVLNSSVEIVNEAVRATTASEDVRVADLWLRLSRIALLELPHRERCVNGRPLEQGSCRSRESFAPSRIEGESAARTSATCPDQRQSSTGNGASALEEDRREATVLQAWHRILSRVIVVTDARLEDPPVDAEIDSACVPDDGTCLPRERPAHVCLGDMLEESVSWLDVDSEEDRNSPKQADLLQAYNEAMEEEMAEERCMPRGFEAIARQQKAPGIVEGMCKCLSF